MTQVFEELRELWNRLPHRLVVLGLLVLWWALFEFYGAAQLSWLPTPSLFSFIRRMLEYAAAQETDDALGIWMPLLFLGMVIFRRRDLLLREPISDRWIGAAVLVLAAILHLFFYSVQQVSLSFFSFLLGVYGLTGVVWGKEWLRRFWFPFVVLLFMIPIVHFLEAPTFRLRHFSASAATWIGQNFLNLKLVRNATMVSALKPDGTPHFQFDVVDACSGIRSLKVILLLTVIFGYVQFQSSWRRWTLLLLAPLLAVGGNVGRLVATFVVGEAFGQSAASRFETNFGFLTFAIAIGGLVLASRWLQEPLPPSDEPAGSSAPTSSPWPLFPTLVAVAMMLVSAGYLHHRGPQQRLGSAGVKLRHDGLSSTMNSQLRTNGVVMPERLADYEAVRLPITREEISILPADTTFGRMGYRAFADGFEAMVSVVLMGTDRTSLHRPEQCLAAQGFATTDRQTVRLALPGESVEILLCQGQGPTSTRQDIPTRAVFAYLYWAADRQTSSHAERQWQSMKDLVFRGEMPRWAGIQCFTRCRPGEENATFEKIKRLLIVVLPALREQGLKTAP